MSTPIHDLRFPLSSFNGRVDMLSLRQDDGEHDHVQFSIFGPQPSAATVRNGTPIAFGYGDEGEFYGYVTSFSPGHSQEDSNRTVITALGASFVMSREQQKIYYATTPSDLVRTLSNQYRLAADTDKASVKYDQISQTGISDWILLRRIARENGYLLHCDKTVVRFKRHDLLVKENLGSIVTLVFPQNTSARSDVWFKPTISDTVGDDATRKASRTVSGVDPRTRQTFSYNNNGLANVPIGDISQPAFFDLHDTNLVANSLAEAQNLVDGTTQHARWSYKAEARVLGNSRLKPGAVVNVTGVANTYAGLWVVTGVEHEFIERAYYCRLTLGTDSLGVVDPRVATTAATGVRVLDPTASPLLKQPETLLYFASSLNRTADPVAFRDGTARWVAGFQPLRVA